MPRTSGGARTLTVTVTGDPHRCERHGQCEGLSERVFAGGGRSARLLLGVDAPSLAAVRRAVRSCPMNALALTGLEHPVPQPEPQE